MRIDMERSPLFPGEAAIDQTSVVGFGPSRAERVEVDGRDIIAVSCFDDRKVWFIDGQNGRTLGVVPRLAGPFEMANDAAHEVLWIGDFRDSILSAIDYSPLRTGDEPRLVANVWPRASGGGVAMSFSEQVTQSRANRDSRSRGTLTSDFSRVRRTPRRVRRAHSIAQCALHSRALKPPQATHAPSRIARRARRGSRCMRLCSRSPRGEVAAVDLVARTVIDSDRGVPGYSFVPASALPTSIVVPRNAPQCAFVASAGEQRDRCDRPPPFPTRERAHCRVARCR